MSLKNNDAHPIPTIQEKSRPAEPGAGPCVFLVHGSGLDNVGDSGQMYSAMERLERLIPKCRVVLARMYEPDDGSLWGERLSAPAPHIYVRARWNILLRLSLGVLGFLHLKMVAGGLTRLLYYCRALRLLWAARFARRAGFVPLWRRSGRQAIHAIRSCDAVYCSGGGNLNDIWLETELLPRVITYRLAGIFEKPLVISGQGIGPLQSKLGRRLLQWGVQDAQIVGCRDRDESRQLLLRLGLSEETAQSLGDDATDLRCADHDRLTQIFEQEGVEDDGKVRLAVHIRLHNFKEDFRTAAIAPLAQMLDSLIERTDCHILFIPVSYARKRAYENDIGDAFEVFARMRHRSNVSFICREKYSPPDMKAIVNACDLLIGFSYHAWIFALTSGTPALGLYYGEYFRLKAMGLFAWYNRPHWAWNVDGLDVSKFVDTVVQVLASADEHRRELTTITDQIIAQVERPTRLLQTKLAQHNRPVGAGE